LEEIKLQCPHNGHMVKERKWQKNEWTTETCWIERNRKRSEDDREE
jgi:hypothetical protein